MRHWLLEDRQRVMLAAGKADALPSEVLSPSNLKKGLGPTNHLLTVFKYSIRRHESTVHW